MILEGGMHTLEFTKLYGDGVLDNVRPDLHFVIWGRFIRFERECSKQCRMKFGMVAVTKS